MAAVHFLVGFKRSYEFTMISMTRGWSWQDCNTCTTHRTQDKSPGGFPGSKHRQWSQWYLVELWRVNACCVMVEEQLEAEFRDGHGPHVGHFDQVLDGGAAVDVHGPGVCSGLQEHLHEDVVAVPGGFVESCLMILFLEVGIWTDGYSDGTAAAQP